MAQATVSMSDLTDWLARFHDRISEQRDYLTGLDSAIGDADHGVNMARGMDAVTAKLAGGSPATVGELFKSVGMTLVSSVGGASGPLYGTFFLRFGTSTDTATELDGPALASALRAGLSGIVARGNAVPGDKTMVDALTPALDAFESAISSGADPAEAALASSRAADAGRDATLPMLARRGRASYLGERSIGHLDPGAASAALLIASLAASLAQD
jgi:phosphoenolpyruvate---glycerone phosphotransferase subunit DhaL